MSQVHNRSKRAAAPGCSGPRARHFLARRWRHHGDCRALSGTGRRGVRNADPNRESAAPHAPSDRLWNPGASPPPGRSPSSGITPPNRRVATPERPARIDHQIDTHLGAAYARSSVSAELATTYHCGCRSTWKSGLPTDRIGPRRWFRSDHQTSDGSRTGFAQLILCFAIAGPPVLSSARQRIDAAEGAHRPLVSISVAFTRIVPVVPPRVPCAPCDRLPGDDPHYTTMAHAPASLAWLRTAPRG